MYFTHLQTTLAGSVLGLLGGGMIYIAGQTGLVPALKSSPAVSLGGGTALGGAIAAITYSVCRVRRIEFEGQSNSGNLDQDDFLEYSGPHRSIAEMHLHDSEAVPQYEEPSLPPSLTPSQKVEAFIPPVQPSPIYKEEFVETKPVVRDEQITHTKPQVKEIPSPWDEEFLSQPIEEKQPPSNGGVKVVKSAFEDFV